MAGKSIKQMLYVRHQMNVGGFHVYSYFFYRTTLRNALLLLSRQWNLPLCKVGVIVFKITMPDSVSFPTNSLFWGVGLKNLEDDKIACKNANNVCSERYVCP